MCECESDSTRLSSTYKRSPKQAIVVRCALCLRLSYKYSTCNNNPSISECVCVSVYVCVSVILSRSHCQHRKATLTCVSFWSALPCLSSPHRCSCLKDIYLYILLTTYPVRYAFGRGRRTGRTELLQHILKLPRGVCNGNQTKHLR